MNDTSFTIVAIDAYHVVARERSYWGNYRPESRASSDRYVLKPGWRAVYGRDFETALVKVTLADGSVGWGEATEPICPEVICRLAVHLVAPFVGGREYGHPSAAWDDAYDLQRVRGHTAGYVLHAMAAIDIAVWDALGHRSRLPLAALLAAMPARVVPAYLSGVRRSTLDERLELLARLVGEGLSAVKIFVTNDTAETLAEIDALRSGVAGPWDIMVDALWTYDSVDSAAAARRALGERSVRWFECPLIPEDLEGHVALSRAGGTSIALGEHFFTHHQSRPWFKARALSVFQPDIGRTGVSDGLRQADLARAEGIEVTPHMGSGSPIVQAAALHFWATAQPDLPCEYQMDLADVLPGVFETGWTFANGGFVVPDRPGLGVAVDEAQLGSRLVTVERWQVG
jgi:L-alanine-DL-glutamate epimerase-like enolase superfamily enzyme